VNQLLQRIRSRTRPRSRGGILIEAAIVLMVFMLLTGAMIEFGWLIYVMHTCTGAARTGARTAIVAGSVKADVDTAVNNVMTGVGYTTSQYTVEVYDKTTDTKVTTQTLPVPGHDVAVHVKAMWSNIGVSFLNLVSPSRQIDCVVVMRKEG